MHGAISSISLSFLLTGVAFIKENMGKLSEAKTEHMTCGFEVVFPALLDKATELGIEGIPYNDPAIQEIFSVREEKMRR